MLSIADKGVGIPQEDLAHIFAPFQRARNVVGKIRGAGLGLASVHAIITQHGGAISVTSEQGVGSTFTIRLPLTENRPAADC
jgi:signal transduction histidine kinase